MSVSASASDRIRLFHLPQLFMLALLRLASAYVGPVEVALNGANCVAKSVRVGRKVRLRVSFREISSLVPRPRGRRKDGLVSTVRASAAFPEKPGNSFSFVNGQ